MTWISNFCSPVTVSSPLNANLTWMFLKVLEDSCTEFRYKAGLTKLEYSLSPTYYGFLVRQLDFFCGM